MSEQRVRIRYSRDEDRQPKNTLATVQIGDWIYFGIARCNSKMDVFNRPMGTRIATERAILALSESGSKVISSSLSVHSSLLRGRVRVTNVVELLHFFETIDERLLNQLNQQKVA